MQISSCPNDHIMAYLHHQSNFEIYDNLNPQHRAIWSIASKESSTGRPLIFVFPGSRLWSPWGESRPLSPFSKSLMWATQPCGPPSLDESVDGHPHVQLYPNYWGLVTSEYRSTGRSVKSTHICLSTIQSYAVQNSDIAPTYCSIASTPSPVYIVALQKYDEYILIFNSHTELLRVRSRQ